MTATESTMKPTLDEKVVVVCVDEQNTCLNNAAGQLEKQEKSKKYFWIVSAGAGILVTLVLIYVFFLSHACPATAAGSTSSDDSTLPTNSSTAFNPISKAIINDWQTCNVNGDSCSNPSFVCCVAPADVGTGKTTCRPNSSTYCASTTTTAKIADWATCPAPTTNVCASSTFGCCVAPADVSAKKYTCRPYNTQYCAIWKDGTTATQTTQKVADRTSEFTYYDPSTGGGYCDGIYHKKHEYVVAFSTDLLDSHKACGRHVILNSNGRSVTVKVVDKCDVNHGIFHYLIF